MAVTLKKVLNTYLDEVDTLDEVDIEDDVESDDDVEIELEVDTLLKKVISELHLGFNQQLKISKK